MGSTRKFSKSHGHAIQPVPIRTVKLRCGCVTEAPPSLSNPDKWYCCGGYQKAKR